MVIEIPLGKKGKYVGMVALVDDEDAELVGGGWYAVKDHNTFYAVRHDRSNNNKFQLMHRLILGNPDAPQIDHRDGNGLNNVRDNLRPATHSLNQANAKNRKHRPAVSGFRGVQVCPTTGRWRARIKNNMRIEWLGTFDSAIEAAKAYDRAARRYFGEFATTNFAAEA